MGREWNDRLSRRLTDSVVRASDRTRAVRILVTDLVASDWTLIEVLGHGREGENVVIAEFLVKAADRDLDRMRYRDETTRWPAT